MSKAKQRALKLFELIALIPMNQFSDESEYPFGVGLHLITLEQAIENHPELSDGEIIAITVMRRAYAHDFPPHPDET